MPTLVTESSSCPARISFGRRLRHWRRHAGLTQAELGRKMAYDHSFISRVERGSRWPTRELALRCDELLGASGELVDLWRQADLERQSPHRPAADPATVAGLATLLADEPPSRPVARQGHAAAQQHAATRAHQTNRDGHASARPPGHGPANGQGNGQANGRAHTHAESARATEPVETPDDEDPTDGHLRQVVRWLEHAPGPVLRRLASLVAGRPPESHPL